MTGVQTCALPISLCAHLEVADMLEDKGVVDVNGLADLVIHGIDIRLVHSHALFGQG